ncbi:hypothetical protein JTE90_001151 [Oedothorax gibbosus]|uniref:Uncharacterized protein n=1 Tax=Oedothorax gibbosus TaxID=931172 RepID=A0AAV6VJ35_9ARAC|nr:hypothetical protein JTE90_001151 [Oedothorax gibbosus]
MGKKEYWIPHSTSTDGNEKHLPINEQGTPRCFISPPPPWTGPASLSVDKPGEAWENEICGYLGCILECVSYPNWNISESVRIEKCDCK